MMVKGSHHWLDVREEILLPSSVKSYKSKRYSITIALIYVSKNTRRIAMFLTREILTSIVITQMLNFDRIGKALLKVEDFLVSWFLIL